MKRVKQQKEAILRKCPLLTVEKVVSDPPKRNNRTRTARYLNRNCVRVRDFESMLRIQGRKIVFQQYRTQSGHDLLHWTYPDPFQVLCFACLDVVPWGGP